MNELEQILGIQLPKNIKISSVVNTTDKVIKDSIFSFVNRHAGNQTIKEYPTIMLDEDIQDLNKRLGELKCQMDKISDNSQETWTETK